MKSFDNEKEELSYRHSLKKEKKDKVNKEYDGFGLRTKPKSYEKDYSGINSRNYLSYLEDEDYDYASEDASEEEAD